MKNCQKCGQELKDEAMFCMACGTQQVPQSEQPMGYQPAPNPQQFTNTMPQNGFSMPQQQFYGMPKAPAAWLKPNKIELLWIIIAGSGMCFSLLMHMINIIIYSSITDLSSFSGIIVFSILTMLGTIAGIVGGIMLLVSSSKSRNRVTQLAGIATLVVCSILLILAIDACTVPGVIDNLGNL